MSFFWSGAISRCIALTSFIVSKAPKLRVSSHIKCRCRSKEERLNLDVELMKRRSFERNTITERERHRTFQAPSQLPEQKKNPIDIDCTERGEGIFSVLSNDIVLKDTTYVVCRLNSWLNHQDFWHRSKKGTLITDGNGTAHCWGWCLFSKKTDLRNM